MKRTLFCLIVCCFMLFLSHPTLFGAEKFKWSPLWKVGETITLKQTKMKDVSNPHSGTILIEVTVLEKQADYYILLWTYIKSEIEGPQKDNLIAKKVTGLIEGVSLKIKLSNNGHSMELLNREEMNQKLSEVIGVFESFLRESKLPDAQVQQLMTLIKNQYQNPQTIEIACLNDLKLFFRFSAGEMELGVPQEADLHIPNPFGGEPLPAKATTTMEKVDQSKTTVTINVKQEVDSEAAIQFVHAFAKQMTGGSLPAGVANLPDMGFIDNSSYQIDLTTGWAQSVEFKRTIQMTGTPQRVQLNRFELVKPAR